VDAEPGELDRRQHSIRKAVATIRLGLPWVSYSSISSGRGTLLGGQNSIMLQALPWILAPSCL
jgi:hypothetical protein